MKVLLPQHTPVHLFSHLMSLKEMKKSSCEYPPLLLLLPGIKVNQKQKHEQSYSRDEWRVTSGTSSALISYPLLPEELVTLCLISNTREERVRACDLCFHSRVTAAGSRGYSLPHQIRDEEKGWKALLFHALRSRNPLH